MADWFCPNCEHEFSQEELIKFKEAKVAEEKRKEAEEKEGEEFERTCSVETKRLFRILGYSFYGLFVSTGLIAIGVISFMFAVLLLPEYATYAGIGSMVAGLALLVFILGIIVYGFLIENQFKKFKKLKGIPSGN